ncbi:membrane alanyl aminopeptidase-like [Rhynchophorus ferrugineus]|uniref:membrane alanyl aminopeptidase-like n=1 Tax=Rhynchophorus ferrugineus TaxID=354439 RepID=UPI003FCD8DF6
MWRILVVGLICDLGFYGTLADDPYRLPKSLLPSKYVVDIKVPSEVFVNASYYEFSGRVVITFSVKSSAEEIKLHHSENVIVSSYVLNKVENSTAIPLNPEEYNSTYQIATIPVAEELDVDAEYELTAEYTAILEEESMSGFYKSTYVDEHDNNMYLVATQFEATYARYAFPCFDEPSFKAIFQLSIEHPRHLTALANTANSAIDDIDDNIVKTSFEPTPLMSSYLVAFVVSSFTCTSGEDIEKGVPYRVCSRSEEEPNRKWAVDIGPPIMRVLEGVTNKKYSDKISKMDQIALPDFSAGAMENWGLVTYRETALLWNENESSSSYKKSVAMVIAHEFTHMWFGNLVTCDWWDYLFLNEGFARYYQYFSAAMTDELKHWELDKHFIVEQLQVALLSDSTVTSQALTSPASTPPEISAKFSTMSYNKGASILHMIKSVIMDSDSFLLGIQDYLNTYSSKSTIPQNLWSSLEKFVQNSSLPDYTDFTKVIASWTEQSGHPVVTVTKSNDDILLSQKRFLLSGDANTEYYVPITFTVSQNSEQFTDTTVKAWLLPDYNLTIKGALKDSSWIVLNNGQAGYYRVNYDQSLWTALKSALLANPMDIDMMNRAQIINDAFNFARADHTTFMSDYSYAKVFDMLRYLEKETDYYPWYAVMTGNNHLLSRIGYDSTEGIQYSKWMVELMQAVYSTVSFTRVNETDMVYTLKQVLILSKMCQYGDTDCIEQAKVIFDKYKEGETINKNFKSFVYCTAMRHTSDGQNDFEFLWQKYKETKLMTERLTIVNGLACINDKDILKQLLKKTIDNEEGVRLQDFLTVWSYVYASGDIAAETCLEFVRDNHEALDNYYKSAASILVTNIAGYLNSEKHVTLLESLSEIEKFKSTVELILETTKDNVKWAIEKRKEIAMFFDSSEPENKKGNAVSLIPSILIAFSLALLHVFV